MKKAPAFLLVVLLFLLIFAERPWADAPSDNPLAGLNLNDGTAIPQPTGLAAKLGRHLIVLEDGHPKSVDAASLQGIKYWAIYYSASWCPPCRAFTPKLVEFYKTFKPQHPDFELIFVNHDQTEDAMLDYMKTDAMPWPAVRFDDIERDDANKYCGPGIPDLVLVDDNGKVLSDSFNGSDYRGPDSVIDDITNLVH